MYRRSAAIVLKDDMVLLVKLKEQDRLLPRATWVFPYLELKEVDSPRKTVNDMLLTFNLKYDLTDKLFRYSPSENPKINYITYVAKYIDGEPDVGNLFQTFKWVQVSDITTYSTSFMDGNVARYLNELKDKIDKFKA